MTQPCTCGGRGICLTCCLPQLMMVEALDKTVAALNAPAKPSNVVSLDGYSKKAQ